MVVIGLVEALKLGSCGSFTSRREATGPATKFTVSLAERPEPGRDRSLAEESKKGAVQGAMVVPMGWTGVGNGLPGDLDVV